MIPVLKMVLFYSPKARMRCARNMRKQKKTLSGDTGAVNIFRVVSGHIGAFLSENLLP